MFWCWRNQPDFQSAESKHWNNQINSSNTDHWDRLGVSQTYWNWRKLSNTSQRFLVPFSVLLFSPDSKLPIPQPSEKSKRSKWIFQIRPLTSVFGDKAELISFYWTIGLVLSLLIPEGCWSRPKLGGKCREGDHAGRTHSAGLSLLSEGRRPRQVSLVSTNHQLPWRDGGVA